MSGGNCGALYLSIQQETERLLRGKIQWDMEIQDKERRLKQNQELAVHQATQIQGLEEDKVRLQGEVFALQEVQADLGQKVLFTQRNVKAISAQIIHIQGELRDLKEREIKTREKSKDNDSFLDQTIHKLENLDLVHDQKMGEIKWKLCELEAEKVRALEVEERKIADLETALAESKEKVDILRGKVDATVQELATKLEMIAEKEAAILELKTEFEARTAEKVAEEDAFNLENKEVDGIVSGLKVELKTLSDEVSAAGRNLDVASAEIKTLNESIEATALETVGLTKAIGENTTKSSKLSVNIRMVDKELEELREENRLLQEKMVELERLKTDYTASSSKLTSSEERNKTLKTAMTNLGKVKREKFELNTKVLDLEKQIYETSEAERAKVDAAEIQNKKSKMALDEALRREGEENATHQEEILAYQSKLKKSIESVSALETELNVLEDNTSRLKLDKAGADVEAAELERALEVGLHEEQQLREDLMGVRAAGDAEITAKQAQIDDINNSLKSKALMLEEGSTRMQDLITQVSELKAEVERTKNDKAEVSAAIVSAKADLQLADEASRSRSQAIESLDVNWKTLLNHLEEYKVHRCQVQAQMENTTRELESERARVETMQAETIQIRREIVDKKSKAQDLAEVKSGLEQNVAMFNNRITEEESRLNRLGCEMVEYKAQVEMAFKQQEEDKIMSLEKQKENYLELVKRWEEALGEEKEKKTENQNTQEEVSNKKTEIDREKEENSNLITKLAEAKAKKLLLQQQKARNSSNSQGGRMGTPRNSIIRSTPQTHASTQGKRKLFSKLQQDPKTLGSEGISSSQPATVSRSAASTTVTPKTEIQKSGRYSAPSTFGGAPPPLAGGKTGRPQTRLSEGAIRKVKYDEDDTETDDEVGIFDRYKSADAAGSRSVGATPSSGSKIIESTPARGTKAIGSTFASGAKTIGSTPTSGARATPKTPSNRTKTQAQKTYGSTTPSSGSKTTTPKSYGAKTPSNGSKKMKPTSSYAGQFFGFSSDSDVSQ